MNGSIYNGRSAILAFQDALSVESNNAANVNTVGFKADFVSFEDMMYQDGVGRGTSRNDPTKNFSQGSLNPSSSEYDFAISGEGFFTFQDPLEPSKMYYSRTGAFHSDNQNYLTNSDGLRVMGVQPVVSGDIITSSFSNNITSTLVDTNATIYTLNTYTSDYKETAEEIETVLKNITTIEAYNNGTATAEETNIIDSNPSLLLNYNKHIAQITDFQNLNSGNNYKSVNNILNDIDKIITSYSNALKSFSIKPEDGTEATKAQSSVIFDNTLDESKINTVEITINGIKVQQDFDTSLTNTLNLFSDKINLISGITSSIDNITGELMISSLVSGENLTLQNPKINDQLFNVTKITEAVGSGENLIDALYTDLQASLLKVAGEVASNKSEIIDPASGVVPVLTSIQLDLNALGLSSTLYEKIVNGDPLNVASYSKIESKDGNIYLNDGNAKFLVGKILPVKFTNVSALNPEGDNVYTKGIDQNDPIYIAGSADVMGKYLERSNIELSETLVNLMVWQRAFEANSKTVTTSDELLKTALALKSK